MPSRSMIPGCNHFIKRLLAERVGNRPFHKTALAVDDFPSFLQVTVRRYYRGTEIQSVRFLVRSEQHIADIV